MPAEKGDLSTTEEFTEVNNTTQHDSADSWGRTRNEETTVYIMTPDVGLKYINHLMQNNKTLSKAGEILTYTDLVSSAFNITTLGIIGYISTFFNNEVKLVKNAYDDLKTMYVAAWPATNMTWDQFNYHYRLEITHISYQERAPQDIGYKKYYILEELHKGRRKEEIQKDFAFSYRWVDRSITIARFVNIETGEYLMDDNGVYVQAQLFEEPSVRTSFPLGKEYLEQNAEVK